MTATHAKDLPTSVGLLYVVPINPSANLPALATDGSNVDDVYDAIKTAYPTNSLKRVASIKDTQVAEEPSANLVEVLVDDGNGKIFGTVKPNAKITATWYESKNVDVREILTGIAAVTVTESSIDYDVTGVEKKTRTEPRFVAVIIATREDGKVEEYWMTDAKVSGEVITAFLKSAGEPTGSNITIELNDGGTFVRKIPHV